MKNKRNPSLHTTAWLLGIVDINGEVLSDSDVLDHHDWSKFLLAREMEKDFDGPSWVPFHLWQSYTSKLPHSQICRTLIYSPAATSLWSAIEKAYPEPDPISIQLPMEIFSAKEDWAAMSKRTPSKHKEHFLRLRANALALAVEVERIEAAERKATGDEFDFMRLYNEQEKSIVFQNVRRFNLLVRKGGSQDVEGMKLGFRRGTVGAKVSPEDWCDYNLPDNSAEPESCTNRSPASYDSGDFFRLLLGDEEGWPGIVPGIPAMLRRLADFMNATAVAPPLKRPKFANAERNHLALHLCHFFYFSFGKVSPAIIASIVSMFHKQGIGDNEVSQMARKLGPLPDDT